LIIEYVFKNLPIQKIYLHTLKDNEKAFKFFKKLGFEIEGILRNEVFKDGKFRDVLIMSIFKENWMKYEKNENYI
jgi:RimJ/RimL family protein N-acetyltransferase